MKPNRRLVTLALAACSTLLLLALLTAALWAAPALGAAPAPGAASLESPQAGRPAPLDPGTSPVETETNSVPPGPRPAGSPAAEVRRAWERARELGVYHFSTSLVEQRFPAPSLLNVGAGPQQQEIHLEGDADLPSRKLDMRLWQGAGSAANPAAAAEIRVEGDKAYARGASGAWQPVDDFSGSFAPGADLMSYLAGIKDVTRLGAETRALPGSGEITFTRYGFRMDGPALAAYMRDRLEEVLLGQGKLPPGVTVEAARDYRELTGEGEVWLDAQGLPLRLQLQLRYPPAANGAYSQAEVRSDFSGFPQPRYAGPPSSPAEVVGWAQVALGRHAADWQAAGRSSLALVTGLGLVSLIVGRRRSRRVYAAVAFAVILAMTVVPLLQSGQVAAFAAEHAEKRAVAEEQLAGEEAAAALAAERASWDPARDPLAGAQEHSGPQDALPALAAALIPGDSCDEQSKTADGDGDGLTDYDECTYGTDTTEPDMDADGLNDGEEVTYLGTSPVYSDTDGDGITDTLEAQGFVYPANGQHWYLDGRSSDTNGDGWMDGLECPPLTRGDTSTTAIAAECDTDADGIPNLVEEDNDADGVPDKIDISPNQVLDLNGVRKDASTIAPFTREQPFSIRVEDLQSGWPAFLDLQLRPQDPKHLEYALNILDWPAADTEGQIQHTKNKTFATSDNPDIARPGDEAGAYGDMRLVPLLEVEMTGSSLPLKLAAPAVTATVPAAAGAAASVPATTVNLAQDPADTKTTTLKFDFEGPGTYTAQIFTGDCPGTGAALWSAADIAGGQTVLRVGTADDGWLNSVADGHHALVISSGAASACAAVPNIINGPYSNRMVDESVLAPYGIGLQETGSGPTAEVLLYVPLNLVSDNATGTRAAFSARMLYWPGVDNTWVEAQKLRMVWAVQALTDSCDTSDPMFPSDLEEYQRMHPGAEQEDLEEEQRKWCLREDHRSRDELSIIQTYDDAFHITGLRVREDHGLDVAVAYPDPAKTYDENPLWQLSWGLGQTFIPGRDCEDASTIVNDLDPDTCHNDGIRDLSVAAVDKTGVTIGNSTIFERFGTSDPKWAGSDALWGIAQGALRVEDRRYDTQDHLAKIAMEVTPAILEQYGTTVKPSLLFAREEHYRSAGLEAGTETAGTLVVSVGSSYQEETLAAMSWAPFQYNSGPGPDGQPVGWEAYPMSEYYDTLSARLKSHFRTLFPSDDDETIAGRAQVAQGYYVSLFNGIAGPVQPCPAGEDGESCPGNEEGKTPEELAEAAEKVGDVLVDIGSEIITGMIEWIEDFLPKNNMPRGGGVTVFFKSLGHSALDFSLGPWKSLFNVAPGAALFYGGLLFGAVLVTIALSFALGASVSGAQLVQRILLAVGFFLNVMVAVKAVQNYIKATARVFGPLTEAAAKHAEGGVTKGGVIRLAIQLVLLWGAFFACWIAGGLAFGSMALDELAATTLAWTLTALLMFLILAALGPVGELIGAIIAAIDAMVRLICNAFLSEEQKEGAWGQWLCGGISGIVKNVFKRWIYSGAILVEMDSDDFERLAFGNFDVSDLTNPHQGVTAGNAIKPSIELTNTIELAKYHFSLVSLAAKQEYTVENLRNATFAYKWQAEETDIHDSLSLGGMAGDAWKPVRGDPPLEYRTTVAAEEPFSLPAIGIDRPIGHMYLSEGYALPEEECWGLTFMAVCKLRTEKGTFHYPFGDRVKFDVLPASLDGFRALEPSAGGYKLAWDPLFARLHDADGDGLSYAADPDDASWDTDGDGLSDAFEVEWGSSPSLVDTDRDGLTDYQEAQLGSNPRQADSDADGLFDCQEARHLVISPDQLGSAAGEVCGQAGSWSGGWELVYGTDGGKWLVTRVTSDPTGGDADGDSYSDALEKIYGFHPRVPSQTTILTLDSRVTETQGGSQVPTDGYVKPGARLGYTAGVKNELNAREAQGLLWTEGGGVLDVSSFAPQSFVLMPGEETSITGELEVSGTAEEGPFEITQAAGALVTNWRELSGEADLWLPFEDATTATTYKDMSGNIPGHDGECGGPAGSCAVVEGGGRYGSALQLSGSGYVELPLDVSETAYALALWFNTTCAGCGIFSVDSGVLGAGGHDRHVYLKDGNLCSRIYVSETICGSGRNLADGQWHHVIHTFGGGEGGQKLYVDGVLAASGTRAASDFAWQDGVNVGFSNDAVEDYFSGLIDDVRIYPRALGAQEARILVDQPVFRMNFEQHTVSGWKDVTGFSTPLAAAASPSTPSPASLGASGWGAEFDGRDGIKVGDDSVERSGHLDLSGGKFTLSAWLRPNAACAQWQSQHILGPGWYDAGYWDLTMMNPPSLYGRVLLQFKDAQDAYASALSAPLLAADAWNHLVVTYDKDAAQYGLVKFYLNGELKEQQQLGSTAVEHPHPASSRHFYIGGTEKKFDDPGADAFCGALDEVAVFNHVLTGAAVGDLMLETAAALRLPLDEPPGAASFLDASLMQRAPGCSAPNCPTAGLPGRLDQAVGFNTAPGHTADHLTLANSEINDITERVTVAAWIKLDELSSFYQFIATTGNYQGGWGFGAFKGELLFNNPSDKSYTSSGANLQAGRWYHAAAVVNGKSLQFYLDGRPLGGPITLYSALVPYSEDPLRVGGSANQFDYWHGLIDDLAIFSAALTPAQIGKLYSMAPALHLRFDEPYAAASFANGADPGAPGACAASATCPLTGVGVKGQIWLAAQFDGENDVVTVPSFGAFGQTTVTAWVKRTGATSVRETIVSYKEQGDCGFVLSLNQDGVNHYPRFDVKVQGASGYPVWYSAESTLPLPAESWQHLAGSYDGKTIRLYRNGSQVASADAPGAMTQCSATSSVGARASNDQHYFPGLIDEVRVFDHALAAGAIRDAYLYQLGWVEDRKGVPLTVDRDSPTATVVVPDPPYGANWPAQVLVQAKDGTSGVDKVQLCVGSAGCSAAPAAPHCVNPGSESAWCPAFTPNGEGVYNLSARVTDKVGYIATSASRQFFVDDTPPVVTLASPANGLWYAASEYGARSNTWAVRFSGAVSDPAIDGGVAGSGVPAGGVRVTLYRSDGGLVGTGPQIATVSDAEWSLDYLFDDADPSGCYKVVVEAVDRVARTAGLPDEQVARHTTVIEQQVSVDGDPAYASLDWTNLPGGQLGPGATSLGGTASSRPVPVVLDFTGGSNSAQTGLILACQHGNEGSWWQPYSTAGAALEAGQGYAWGEEGKPLIHRGSACQVQLTTAAASDDLSGAVTVCGEQVLSWSGPFASPGRTLSFVADSAACGGGNGCPAGTQKATAGIQGVDVSFLPVTPGSPFYNETAPQGEALHLTMDSALDGSGNPAFSDVSGNNLAAACSGSACPVAGQQGHTGRAARFDGVDDVVTLPDFGAFTGVTASAWVNPARIASGQQTAISYKQAQGCGFWLGLLCDGAQCLPQFRIQLQLAKGGVSPATVTGAAAPAGRWTHLAATYDGSVVSLLQDGQQVASSPWAGSMVQCSPAGVAAAIGSDESGGRPFPGLIDEVRVLDHALAAPDVSTLLYLGTDPSLVLPFEKQWAADGSVLEDASGWQNDATLVAGTSDAAGKAVTGGVGRYALAFDGVDDYAAVPDSDSIDFAANQDFAVSAWIRAAPVQVSTVNVDNNVVEKWSGSGGYPFVIRYLNQASGDRAGKVYAMRWDGQHGSSVESTARVDDGRFHHVAFVKRGSTLALYVDGLSQGQTTDTASGVTTNASPLYIGRRGGSLPGYFTGSVDDVRVYPRSLSEAEVHALFLMGWQPATVSQSGPDVESTRWTIEPPKWLEGSYRIEARGWDTDGHTAPPRSPVQTWSGEADTLAPRVALVRSPGDAGYRYTTTAEDYNLAAAGLVTPCPGDTVTVTTGFTSPWYLAAYPATPRLYRIVQECVLPVQAAGETATACDTFGNCATAPLTLAASLPPSADAPAYEQAELELDPASGSILSPIPVHPAIDFVPTVLTTTHLYPPSVVRVTGLVTGTGRIRDLVVSIGGTSGPAVLAPPADSRALTATWSYPWPLGPSTPLPDGVVVPAVATATLTSGLPLVQGVDLTVDVAPPAAVPLTLEVAGSPLQPGDTVRAASPELRLTWPPAADGSGIGGYTARWRAESRGELAQSARAVAAEGPLEDRYTAGEAQRLVVDLASRDLWGNVRWQELGPVYVDGPLTPDYIALGDQPYEGWQESGCSFLGADRRLEWRTPGVGKAQRLYVTWDSAALRLAWTGASWSSDGDLFVYLDTGPGGANTLYNPAGSSPGRLQLRNDALQADVVVWVRDAQTASLLRWDGAAWAAPVALSAGQYRFDAAREGGQADLYLPFAMLDIAPASGLGLLAVAASEPVAGEPLQLWATLPQLNPVNSPLVNRMLALVPEGSELALAHAYRWTALGDGVCPNGGGGTQPLAGLGDAQPQLSVESDPPGIGLTRLGRGLFWLTEAMLANAGEISRPGLEFLRAAFPPVDVGQAIRYTVRYRNAGGEAQRGVRIEFTGYGVQLASPTLELGDVAAGAEVLASIDGRVTGDGLRGVWAAVHGRLYDDAHGDGEALEWLWAAHRLDAGAPQAVNFEGLGSTVGPRTAALAGEAFDESGVRDVEVEVTGSGGTRTITCPVERPAGGRWRCLWEVGAEGLPDGAEYTLRVRATDLFGHTGEWSAPRTVRVDARPPELDITSVLNTRVTSGAISLFGRALDASGIGGVQVCVDDKCERASLLAQEGSSARWTYRLPGGPADYVTRTISIKGSDRLGNRGGALSAAITVDNVPPQLATTQERNVLALGDRQAVLRGTVTDGGPGPRVYVRVQSPGGAQTRGNAARSGGEWWVELAGEIPGRYTLWLEAVDAAGNTATSGPYTVDVTCVDARLETSVTAQRGGATGVYSITAAIANTGPDGLPAGVPLTLFVGDAPLGPPAPLPALEPGQSTSVQAVWTSPGPARYELSAVVGHSVAGEPPAGVLCATPPMGKALVGPDVDLRITKTVQPAVAVPGSAITYTLTYSNAGADLATSVAITDPLPVEILSPAYQAAGPAITQTLGSANFAWQVADLAGGEGGEIVITGTLDPALTLPLTITNVVTITSPLNVAPAANVAAVQLPVVPEIIQPTRRAWLPVILR